MKISCKAAALVLCFLTGCATESARNAVSPTSGANLLDILPKDSSRIIPLAELKKHGLIGLEGTIEAVDSRKRKATIMATILFGNRDVGTPSKNYTLAVPGNAKIIRSSVPIRLKDVNVGEKVSALAQKDKDGRWMAVSLAFGIPRGYPVATPVPDKPSWVYSPYAPTAGPVDVSAFPPGSEVRCPYTKKIFFTPFVPN